MVEVSIIMGSDSDLHVMSETATLLDLFKVKYEITIISAHRTPERMFTYAKEAVSRGIKIIIAGAGGAAHLPGMVASLTTLPVIGVPIMTKALNGVDSLYSIVQMPKGVPVATVAINGGLNAGLIAVKILAISNNDLTKAIVDYQNQISEEVCNKADHLEKFGAYKYFSL